MPTRLFRRNSPEQVGGEIIAPARPPGDLTSAATEEQWLWLGLGLLSKYTAVAQIFSFLCRLILWPRARAQLRRPGPYLGLRDAWYHGQVFRKFRIYACRDLR